MKIIDVVGEEPAVALNDGADAMLSVIDRECLTGGRAPGLRASECCFFSGYHRPPLLGILRRGAFLAQREAISSPTSLRTSLPPK